MESKTPKFVGYCEILPIKRGDTVTITKGVMVKHTGQGYPTKPAGRTFKVKVHHLLNGSNLMVTGRHEHEERPASPPVVRWAGSGGYWREVDINEIPEAQ